MAKTSTGSRQSRRMFPKGAKTRNKRRKRLPQRIIDPACSICQEPLGHVAETTRLPCRHTFHTECINEWMQHRMTCPDCRAHIPATLGPPQVAQSESDSEPEFAFTSDRDVHPPVPPFVQGRIIFNAFRRRGTGGIPVFRDSHGRLYEGDP
jgi:hypothetical protein